MDTRYWAKAMGAFARHLRDRRFLAELGSLGLQADRRPKAPSKLIAEIIPNLDDIAVDLGTIRFRTSNQDPLERFFLGAWCQAYQPKRIFEIGTYDGTTTLLMARNAPGAEIFTLDLPPSDAESATFSPEVDHVRGGGVGASFRDAPEAERITQLLGNSRTFDFSAWTASIDLVVVDGGHEYDCASADTATACALVRQGGAIVWDDYDPAWPSVIRAVDESGLPAVHVIHTGLAVVST
jgi:hypothetical protein